MTTSAPAQAAAAPALDTLRAVATPEGIELDLRLAGPVPRAVAWAVDFLLRGVLLMIASWLALPLGGLGLGLILLLWFFLEWLFPAVCEVYWQGATPGKKLMGLAVVRDDGAPVDWPAALIRNLLRAVDFLPVVYGIGFVAMVASRDFKRLGDLVAGTVVVYLDPPRKAAAIPRAEPVAPRVKLTLAEQRVVLDYAERVAGVTPARGAELAELAEPITGVARGDVGRDRLIGIANHLLGRKGG